MASYEAIAVFQVIEQNSLSKFKDIRRQKKMD